MTKTLTIDLRKVTHSGIGRYLRNIVPGALRLLRADRVVLLGKPAEIGTLGQLPSNVSVTENATAPHSPSEQMMAFSKDIAPRAGERRVLWVPHYNIPLLYHGPLVCTVHDLAPLDLQETFGGAKRALSRVLLQSVAKRSSAILTPSEFSRRRITEALGVPPERITVTPLAVDTDWPELTQPNAHAEAEPYLLFVGNLKSNKNLATLLKALQSLGSEAPLLLVAGKTDGLRTADEESRRAAESLQGRVRMLGAVSEEHLVELYRGALAFVMPSLYEGFGLPVLEAMRYGCPVLCSNATSLPEVAGDAAILFDPRDPKAIAAAIQRVLQPGERVRLSAAGIAREAHFTYGPAIERSAATLNAVLEATT